MVYVVAEIELAEGAREQFLRIFRELVPKVRAEEGCIEYGPAVDVQTDLELQQPVRPNVVTVLEKWESVDALKKHLAAPHMQQYRESVKDLVRGVKLFILEPA